MAVRIKVTPNQLTGVSNKIRGLVERSNDIKAELEKEMSNLSGEWEGMAKEQFYIRYDEWIQKALIVNQDLEKIAIDMKDIADRFEEKDTMLAKQINSSI